MLHYLTLSYLWQGVWISVQIAAVSMAAALVIGLGLALMRESRHPLVRWPAAIYVWLMRGTPILLQLVFIFDALPSIGLRLSPVSTAMIGFALNEAAFCGEIIRGGIRSVNASQLVAARSLGMGSLLTLRRVILPQALRAILPALGNDAISLLKSTSLASIIAVDELTLRSENIVAANFDFFPVFLAAGAIYLAVTSVMAVGQNLLEKRFSLDRPTETPRRRLIIPTLDRPQIRQRPRTRHDAVADDHRELGATLGAAHAVHEPPIDDTASRLTGSAGQAEQDGVAELVARQALKDTDSEKPYLDCRNLRKLYGDRTILEDVSLQASAGEVVVLMGPSGSGKSTLLRLINHLEHMDAGEILVAGEHVGYEHVKGTLRPAANLARARARARIGMVFQHFNLFDHLTVLDNVSLAPVHVFGVEPVEARRTSVALLADVGLAQHAHHLPHRLSGGQQQRVAIARALAIRPRMMLFDEPTSALDPELVGEVLGVIRRLARAGMTMLVVTHEVRFAREVADRVVFMADGRIVEQGPPNEVLGAPSQARTRQFLNLVSGGPDAGRQ